MRRVLPGLLLIVLAAIIAVGCSRQPTHHVGEWSGNLIVEEGDQHQHAIWHIYEDGNLNVVTEAEAPDPPTVQKGRYKFDYSKKPIQLDINWNDNVTLRGKVQFIGENKNIMHIFYFSSSPGRSTNIKVKEPHWLLKKVE